MHLRAALSPRFRSGSVIETFREWAVLIVKNTENLNLRPRTALFDVFVEHFNAICLLYSKVGHDVVASKHLDLYQES